MGWLQQRSIAVKASEFYDSSVIVLIIWIHFFVSSLHRHLVKQELRVWVRRYQSYFPTISKRSSRNTIDQHFFLNIWIENPNWKIRIEKSESSQLIVWKHRIDQFTFIFRYRYFTKFFLHKRKSHTQVQKCENLVFCHKTLKWTVLDLKFGSRSESWVLFILFFKLVSCVT